ncbi:GTPase [Massilia niastensis]|uniref:GTPase n=1 Tax=Massilia niastensis TaxID=544911 RepID=UPI00036642FA|nr:GTPase [Massilia niastensis]
MTQQNNLVLAQQHIDAMLDAKTSITILLAGRTGVGKSSTINSLLGTQVAPVGKFRPTTISVARYPHEHGGLHYDIVDTPGLCDDLPEVGNDQRYLAAIREASAQADCLLFITELDATRVSSDERRGIQMLTEALGASVWENALLVFTRADKVEAKEFEADFKERTGLLRETIAAYAPLHAAYIPALAVSNTSEKLPNGKPWLSELFTQVLTRLRHDATVPFLHSMRKDVGIDPSAQQTGAEAPAAADPAASDTAADKPAAGATTTEPGRAKPRIDLDPEQQERVKKTVWDRILKGVTTGAAVGAKIGKVFGKRGEAIGAAIGAVGGALLGWLL